MSTKPRRILPLHPPGYQPPEPRPTADQLTYRRQVLALLRTTYPDDAANLDAQEAKLLPFHRQTPAPVEGQRETPLPPFQYCPRCFAALGAQYQGDGWWELVCLTGCAQTWADWHRGMAAWDPRVAPTDLQAAAA